MITCTKHLNPYLFRVSGELEINRVSQINAKSLPRFSKSLIVERMSLSVKVINQDTLKNKSSVKLTNYFRHPQNIKCLEKRLFFHMRQRSSKLRLAGLYPMAKIFLSD
jgi:hypothetical protein